MKTLFSVTETVETPYPGYLSIDHDEDASAIVVTVKHKGRGATLATIIIDEDSAIAMATAIMSAIGKLSVSERKVIKNK